MRRGILLALIVGVLLAGCGTNEAIALPQPTATRTPDPHPFIEQLPTANIFTPVSVRTNCTPASTAAIRHYTPNDVADVLTPLGAREFHSTPLGVLNPALTTAVDQRAFIVPSVAPQGGQILFFGCANDATAAYDSLTHTPDRAPYVYAKGNVVLQLNSGVAKVEAEKYRVALESLP